MGNRQFISPLSMDNAKERRLKVSRYVGPSREVGSGELNFSMYCNFPSTLIALVNLSGGSFKSVLVAPYKSCGKKLTHPESTKKEVGNAGETFAHTAATIKHMHRHVPGIAVWARQRYIRDDTCYQ